MRGLHFDGRRARLLRDLPSPSEADGEVVLDVLLAGVCHTDLQIARGYMGFRGILGHEFVGRDPVGRRVVAEINAACHACPTCRSGRPNHCPNRTVLGILGRDGAMADRVRVPVRNLHIIPDHVPDAEAVFVEPLAAAFRIAQQIPLGPDSRVAVLGDGKLGLLCAWAVRTTGAAITLVGKNPSKMALAGTGIDILPLDQSGDRARSFDVVVDATGSPSGLPAALGLVEPCGTVVLKTTVAGEHALSLAPIVIDEVRVVGSRCGPFAPAIAALSDRAVDVRPLIQEEFLLDHAEEALRAAGEPGARKVLIRVES